jgi:outer membrane protein assembly factor BamB
MVTKSQAGVTVGFTLVTLLGFQISGYRLNSAASLSVLDPATELDSQQSVVSDRSEGRLNSDGTMFGVTLRRTRVYDAQGLQEPKSVLWKTPKLFTINPRENTPSIPIYHGAMSIITANKEAYFTERVRDGYSLFVIDLQTGETKKLFKLLGGDFSAPVVAGDLLFVGESKGSFLAFDRRDWKAKWEIGQKGYYTYGTAPAIADGMIYFGAARIAFDGPNRLTKGSVNAVDALTGTQKWMFTVNASPRPIAVADGVIYFGDDDRHLFAVNAKDGQEIWQFKASDNVRIPAIMEGRAFFSDDGGNLYAVDLKNGKAVWKAAKKNKVATVLAAYNKLVYYGGRGNSLYAVDAFTGEEKWVYRTTKPCPAPVAANGAIYVACQDSTLLAIDAESGQEKWKYKTPRLLWSHPVVGNGVIYYLDEEGVMYALSSS